MAFLPLFDQLPSPLSEEIQRGIQQVNRAHRLFLFTEGESKYVRDRKKALLSYRQFLETNQPIPEELRSFILINKEQERRVKQKEYLYNWKKKQQQWFDNEDIWQKLIERSPHASEIQTLQLNWQTHSALSRWNNPTLLYVAVELLPKLIDYHQKKLLRCQNNDFLLPPMPLQAYQNYLNHFLEQAEQLKKQIAESMFARLRAMVWNQFQHADVTTETVLQLQSFECLSKATKLPSTALLEPLTPKQFSTFHGYLLQEHSAQFKEKISILNWLADETQLTALTQKKSLKALLVPPELVSFIPQKKRWLASLFSGHRFRRKFFKDKELLLAKLMTETTHKSPIQLDNVENFLKQLQSKEETLQDFLRSLRPQKSIFRRFWHSKTQRFIKTWENWLRVQKEKVVSEKINFLESIVDDFQQRERSDLIFPWEYCQSIHDALQQLQKHSLDNPQDEVLTFKLQKIINGFSEVLLTNKAYQLIKTMAMGELIKQNDIEFLKDFHQTTLLYNPQASHVFCQMVEPWVQQIYAKLKESLSTFCFKTTNPSKLQSHIDTVLCFNYFVEIFGTSQQKESVKSHLLKYSLHYLEGLLRSDSLVSKDALNAVETIVMMVGTKITYGSESLSSFVEELKKLREKVEWGVMTAKCKSVLLVINHELLKKRLTKEISMLDKGIANVLGDDPNLNYSSANRETFFHIRDQMVEKGVTDVAKLGDCLPKHQQILSGIDCHQTKNVQLLLKISAKAHRVADQIKSEKNSYLEKNAQMEKLTHWVEKSLSHSPEMHSSFHTYAPFFSQRKFFSKRYVDKNISHTLTR